MISQEEEVMLICDREEPSDFSDSVCRFDKTGYLAVFFQTTVIHPSHLCQVGQSDQYLTAQKVEYREIFSSPRPRRQISAISKFLV